VVLSLGIISVIPRLKAPTRSAKPLSSTPSMVCMDLFVSKIVPLTFCLTLLFFPLDFCIWAPSEPGHTVGDIEGEMIAWCTKPGHGTRVMPKGTITGVQFTRTPDYIQVVGFMDQTKINMVAGDTGGEMDPHGADLVSGRICRRIRRCQRSFWLMRIL